GAIAGGIASALAGGAMSKLFGGGQKAASGGIQGDVLATDNNTVGMGDAGIKSAIQGSNVPNYINIIARRTGKDVNSHTVLDGIITTIMATIQRINIIGSREGSRNRRRLKANQTGKKFRVGIKSNISTNRNNLISGVDRCI